MNSIHIPLFIFIFFIYAVPSSSRMQQEHAMWKENVSKVEVKTGNVVSWEKIMFGSVYIVNALTLKYMTRKKVNDPEQNYLYRVVNPWDVFKAQGMRGENTEKILLTNINQSIMSTNFIVTPLSRACSSSSSSYTSYKPSLFHSSSASSFFLLISCPCSSGRRWSTSGERNVNGESCLRRLHLTRDNEASNSGSSAASSWGKAF